jgi:ABC-type lipoprotein export system ATPase subunit
MARRRLRRLIERALSPRFAFVVAHRASLGATRRRVAMACIVQGRSLREASGMLGLSLHAVRRHIDAVEALFAAARTAGGGGRVPGLSGSARQRLLCAVAPFGIEPGSVRPFAPGGAGERERARRDGARLLELLDGLARARGGAVALVTGPSGSGKSTRLASIGEILDARRDPFSFAGRVRADPARPVASLRAGLAPDAWLGVLSSAGLAEARLLATPAGALSEGERARLRLALAMSRVPEGGILIIDEFCSTLDRATAAGVSASLHRWAGRLGVRVIVASGHEDLARLLGPDLILRTGGAEGGGDFEVRDRRLAVPRGGPVRIGAGSPADVRALSRHHYRAGRVASPCRVLRATGEGGRLLGVLVATHPTLNGAWRDWIWPGRYSAGDKPARAARLNRELRRISRVIVDPRDRGRGVATRLVRAYLDDAPTPATEAVSAMGRLSPFWVSAGMTAYDPPPRPADDRLADMLVVVGVEAWELLDPARVDRLRMGRDRASALVRRELGIWARAVASSIPKPRRGWTDPLELASLAGARLVAPPMAYGWSA